ncbi:MAG: LysM peptidoglycan-binding domain-containing protein [Oligoflexia bacterium]|nr:LysM peptidoglycan-binding domain-containing protein [Oligoflexia bacterium]
MRKTSVVLHLLLSALLFTVVSCSSSDEQAEEGSSDVAEASADDGAPVESGDSSMTAGGEQSPPPESAEGEVAAAPTDGEQPSTDGVATEQAPTDSASTDTAAAPTESAPTETAQNDSNSGDLFGAGTTDSSGEPPAPRKKLPLTHIKDVPFEKGGQLLNTVYLAREGDDLAGISQKLFGEDKSKQLKKANPHLKKGVKTGDKVYFNSPTRPDDREKLITVYEDQGLPASTYTTKEGDTLKTLASEWYGAEGSYREIFSINKNLAAPTDLPPGTELQYWPPAATIAAYGAKPGTEVAQAPPPPPVEEPVVAAPPTNTVPTPVPAIGAIDPNIPPVSPPTDLNAPPPPPIAKRKKEKDGMDKDTVMYAAVGGVLLIGGGALVAIRRRNARKSQGLTQV